MPSVPSIAEETVCEINRDFLTRAQQQQPQQQGGDVSSKAHEQYNKVLNRVFPKLLFKVGTIPIADDNGSNGIAAQMDISAPGGSLEGEEEDLVRATAAAVEETLDEALGEPLSALQRLGSLFYRGEKRDSSSARPKFLQSMAWHKHKLLLAFVANPAHVLVVDYDDADAKNPFLLGHETQQRGVEAIEWRPNSGSILAVGCRGGVCLWTASGATPPLRTGAVVPLVSAATKWSLVDFLRWGIDMPVSALSWSPCGRLLACGSSETPTFAVWDVSLGESTPLRRGMAGVQFMKWSPLGDYLLTAKVDASFHLWETMTWTSEPWASAGGALVGAAWSPDGRMIMGAFDQSSTLGTLHFAGKPPSLEVHLLPLGLSEIEAVCGPGGSIERMAWDGTGERLAVSYTGGDAVYSGLIAIYDTRRTPIISASLLGFVRGPGAGAKPLAFAFHDKLRQGALLGVCWSTGFICVYPMLFRTGM
ncbi:aladin [Selaginella moellendorffii]|uniref:aladin n=1 Tax=Selaginella moellendorffii TaxID=88036 RepID=UPI000D1C366E|nr:aladin [Selaginella moellendorffii]XP_024522727.1 aladin [Selaginella moellendorffii]|eukprot:XP_024522725.1 aladin [Selaginella moellendorffii]